ncbi:MAG: branched-chain amino acid ABC transporter permease [Burkholderiales bacterium]
MSRPTKLIAPRPLRKIIPWLEFMLLAISLIVPVFADDFWTLFFTRVFILGLLALSFDLVWGYTGILSFGQALFFGMAGYCTALLATEAGINSVLVLLPVAGLVGLIVSLILAFIVILGRRVPSTVFVALGTLTGSYVVERLARGWSYVGGQNGIPSLPRLTFVGHEITEGVWFYYMALTILFGTYVALKYLTRSQFGLVLAGIRQHETRITFFGYRVQHVKGIIFALGGFIAGLAGGMYAFHEGYVGPGQLSPVLSTQVVLYVLFGGVGTLIGAILGAGVIEYLSFMLSQEFQRLWPIILGLLLLTIVMFRPTGLIGFFASDRERIGSFGRPNEAAPPADADQKPA